jgi:hypothetical protein
MSKRGSDTDLNREAKRLRQREINTIRRGQPGSVEREAYNASQRDYYEKTKGNERELKNKIERIRNHLRTNKQKIEKEGATPQLLKEKQELEELFKQYKSEKKTKKKTPSLLSAWQFSQNAFAARKPEPEVSQAVEPLVPQREKGFQDIEELDVSGLNNDLEFNKSVFDSDSPDILLEDFDSNDFKGGIAHRSKRTKQKTNKRQGKPWFPEQLNLRFFHKKSQKR